MASVTAQLSAETLTAELLHLGFKEKLVNEFVNDPFNVASARTLLKSYVLPLRLLRSGRYNNLCLNEDARNQNWAIYDPSKHDPLLDEDMLKIIVRFAIYTPGNPRFIEYNTCTSSLRIRSSRILAGQRINYTANGPQLEPLEEESISETESNIGLDNDMEGDVTLSSARGSGSDSELTDMESEGDEED